ncbi:MAG: hypothetical protein PHW60_03980 [Kiritimatiellae bacterium]|nr:hypothetical protein [Kiritimatiellia bacterium]
MTNAIIEAVKVGLEATGGLPWQIQLGMAAGGVVIGIIGGIIGWFGGKIKSGGEARKANTKPS